MSNSDESKEGVELGRILTREGAFRGTDEKSKTAVEHLLSGIGGVRDIVENGKLGDRVAILILVIFVTWYGSWDGFGIAIITLVAAGFLNAWEKRRL